jgi:hypothetical protein
VASVCHEPVYLVVRPTTLTEPSEPLPAATIPLPGIDVPFHSKYLWSGVSPFLKYLSKKVSAADLNPELLVGLYIPNLIADPFQISREYAQKILDQTGAFRPSCAHFIAVHPAGA